MHSRTMRVAMLGIASAAAALTAAAATISSPYRPTSSSAAATRLSAPGQEAMDLDRSALAALHASTGDVSVADFPVAPGRLRPITLRRFEVVSPNARITV